MSKYFKENITYLDKELNGVNNNFNLIKNKTYNPLSKLVKEVKNIPHKEKSNLKSKLLFSNDNNKNIKEIYNNFKKSRPNIFLFSDYIKANKKSAIKHNLKLHNKTINNCTIINREPLLNNKKILNINKYNYSSSKNKNNNTIDFNTNNNNNLTKNNSYRNINKKKLNLNAHLNFNINYKKLLYKGYYINKKNKEKRSDNNLYNNKIKDMKDIKDILYFNYSNSAINHLNKTLLNNHKNYFRKSTKKDNKYYKNKIFFKNQKEFMDEINKIYNKYNDGKQENNDYDKIILWINELINDKTNNKYEKFCKQIMKENNISDFSGFKNFCINNINEQNNANFFIKDMKKILFKNNYNNIL